jgi:hypothetical protein
MAPWLPAKLLQALLRKRDTMTHCTTSDIPWVAAYSTVLVALILLWTS